ncbi:hypothetical protein FO519_007754 [Halicephalobus sp. NKZ332]|nr:hypothetical protein FO519_007754 [Halicephalobus sp. NKZ332]
MNIDPYSSDSSSWSLVDVEDGSDSELDSIGGHLIVESVHDSESESEVEEESEEEVDIAEEALEETEINEEVHNNDEEVDEEADEDVNEGIDGDVEEESDEEDSEPVNNYYDEDEDEDNVEEDNEDENLEILEESEAMEEAAAKHFVEPTKVVKKLEELSKSADSPFDKMMDKISATDNAKSFAFVIVVLATLMGAGLGHYIGACLIGDKQFSIEEGSFSEGGIMNLTKSIFFSFSNWTSHQPVVQNLIKYTPSFDESLEKVSAWIRNSKGFNNVVKKVNSLAKLPQISNTVFDAVPKKVKEFMRSDLRILATKAISKATTALTERNFSSFSTLVSEYRKSELVKNIRQQVKSALNQLKNFSLSKFSSDVCFAKDSKNYFPKSSEFCSLENCDSASKLATVIEKNSELVIRIGKKRVEEYVRFLKSLSIQNCSKQIQCERDWWMGCGPQFLENCNLQQWQEKRYFSGASLMNRRQDVKRVALDLGWIEQKNRRSSVKCPRLSSAPLPCPAALPLPSILPDSLAPCHPGPNSAKPCQSTIPLPRPCPTNNKFVKPSGDGRPDWFSERAQTRAKQRALQNPRPSKVPRPSKMPQYPQFSKVSVKKSRTLVFSETRP